MSNPFSPEIGILCDDPMDDETLLRAYQGAPVKFFDEIWQSFVSIIIANLDIDSTVPHSDNIWLHYDSQFSYRLHEKLIRGVEAGIRAVAVNEFNRFCEIVITVA